LLIELHDGYTKTVIAPDTFPSKIYEWTSIEYESLTGLKHGGCFDSRARDGTGGPGWRELREAAPLAEAWGGEARVVIGSAPGSHSADSNTAGGGS
jgi:hypothetical protein